MSEEIDESSVKFRRGEADGKQGHPPSELTIEYVHGYCRGLKLRQESWTDAGPPGR